MPRHILSSSCLLLLLHSPLLILAQESPNPLTLHGGSVLAMAGKDCVGIAVDKRFASGSSLIDVSPRRVVAITPTTLVALTGLEGDVQTVHTAIATEYRAQHQQQTGSTQAIASLTSHVLYQQRSAPFYVEPVIVGLERVQEEEVDGKDEQAEQEGEHVDITTRQNPPSVSIFRRKLHQKKTTTYRPYLCSMDCIGARSMSLSFCAVGAATRSLYGVAGSLWKPNMKADELRQVMAKVFLSCMERDTLSGNGAVIYILTRQGVTEYNVEGRSD